MSEPDYEDAVRQHARVLLQQQSEFYDVVAPLVALHHDLVLHAAVDYAADVLLVLPNATLANVPTGSTLWGLPVIHADVERAGLLLMPKVPTP